MSSYFYKNTGCCILVYDVTNPQSFTDLGKWGNEFLRQAEPKYADSFPFIVLGNKIDKKSEKKVDDKKVKDWCNENNMSFFLTSAKEYINVEKAFEKAAELFLNMEKLNKTINDRPTVHDIKLSSKTKKKTNCC